MYELFMANYGTAENYLRCYGGVVEASETSMTDGGELTISFNRDIVYPRELLSAFDLSYK
jgi:hypothetical protein